MKSRNKSSLLVYLQVCAHQRQISPQKIIIDMVGKDPLPCCGNQTRQLQPYTLCGARTGHTLLFPLRWQCIRSGIKNNYYSSNIACWHLQFQQLLHPLLSFIHLCNLCSSQTAVYIFQEESWSQSPWDPKLQLLPLAHHFAFPTIWFLVQLGAGPL